MLLKAFFSWWFGPGWSFQVRYRKQQIQKVADFFSIHILLSTLFSPFRQSSAGRVRGPLGVQIQAWFDRLISRFIGAMVRIVLIVIGLFALMGSLLLSLIILVMWPILPFLPVVGMILAGLGVNL